VREALRCLAEIGLISRNRGIGTVVMAREPSSAHVQKLGSPAGWMRYAEDSRLEVIGNEALRVDAELARRLQCRRGALWRRITALRRLKADRVLIGWSDIYLPEAYAGVVGAMGSRAGRVYELIESRFFARVARSEVQVAADVLDAQRARALGVPVNSASLRVTRRYRAASGQVLLLSQTQHPAERFTYAFDLLRGGDGSAWFAA
jgi:DNA-binding GntR family transcriptional regulator